MKNLLLSFVFAFSAITVTAQTATDFTANDCAGNSHNLFSELDSGKVIVIAWVMPCGSCMAPTQTASSVVQGYASSNPGQVKLYVVDDYGNTNCTSLSNWCNTNNIIGTAFSNSAIDMTDYGSAGMPKIVVLGGTGHYVFFNQNNSASNNATGIGNAIDQALLVGVNETASPVSGLSMTPNPVTNNSVLTVNMETGASMDVRVYNTLGQEVMSVYSGFLVAGENRLQLNFATLASGTYFVSVSDGTANRTLRFTKTE